MKKEKPSTKTCKHCKTEIPYEAKVCPQCRKKQSGGCLSKIIIGLIVLIVIGIAFSGGEEEPVKEEKTTFVVKETFTSDDVVINFISAGDYDTDNEFMQPADGNKYVYAEFEITNPSDYDLSIGSWSFACYADDYACEEAYFDDDDLTAYDSISPGKKINGKIYYEVPEDSNSIILEYEADIWEEKKITFVIK